MTDPKFAYDQVEVDSSKIREYDHSIYGPTTVFEDVVIAREIVQKYEDGRMAYKPADELEASYWTADGMWAIAGGHPETVIIMDRDQMQGKTVNPRFVKNLFDHKKTNRPNVRGIIADLEVYNDKVSPDTLKALKSGEKRDVSIGFTYLEDDVGGTIDQDGHPLNGVAYDYVQRKIAINHTAFALDAGRCPMPFCGIGADEIKVRLTGDPFGGYETWEECIADIMKQNPDYTKKQAEGTCGLIEKRSKAKKDTIIEMLTNWRDSIEEVLNGFESEEQLKEDEAQEVGDSMSLEEIKEWFGKLSDEAWADLEETQRQVLISLYNDKYPTVIQDAIDECPDCEDDNEEIKRIATDLSLEDIDKKLKELKTTRERLREQVRVLDEKLYQEPDTEKKRKAKIREQRGELWDKIDDLYDEIRAYTQAKTMKITQSALLDEDKNDDHDESTADKTTKETKKTDEFDLDKYIPEEEKFDPSVVIIDRIQ